MLFATDSLIQYRQIHSECKTSASTFSNEISSILCFVALHFFQFPSVDISKVLHLEGTKIAPQLQNRSLL